MFQDWQSIPARYISESGLDSEYFEYKDKIEGMSETMAEAYEEYINEGGYNGEEFEDMYQGQYESEEAFAEQLLDDCGTLNDIPQHLRYYFDYTAYARDLFINDYFITSNGFVFIRHQFPPPFALGVAFDCKKVLIFLTFKSFNHGVLFAQR